ncbi:C25 family cysteine peptidase [Pontibacter chitinilyticus]|uniref:putative type IX secretion system sortase PorU2 n=1 Tax=Pontibacter chitinilyticus TaxID=2674989 RepID=UPI003219CCEA
MRKSLYSVRLALALLFFILGSYGTAAYAQSKYGNEWINNSQTYYKLKIINTGLHRLSYGYLDSLGLSNVNPQQLQLFRRGKEVALYVAGEADGKLDAPDYVEFYGERNDGALDGELYQNPANQVNQFYSLYTDTAAYFLTINPAGGKRMRQENTAVTGRTPEPYQMQKAFDIETPFYYVGRKYDQSKMPWMDEGEGYFSLASRLLKTYTISGITNILTTGPKPYLEFATVGENYEYHTVDVNILKPDNSVRKLNTYKYGSYSFAKDIQEIEFSEISTQGKLTVQVVPLETAAQANQIAFSYGTLTYPQKTAMSGNSMFFYTDSTRSASPYFEYTNLAAAIVAYDVTNPYNPIRIEGYIAGTKKGFVINSGTITHKVLLANTLKPFKPKGAVKQVKFREITPAAYNYIIVTNKRLMKQALGSEVAAPLAYAAYRSSAAGGGYEPLVMEMDEIVNQFHYGDFSSNAIRHLMQYMLTSDREKQLFIIGKGIAYADDFYRDINGKFSYYQPGARNPLVYTYDLVPTGIAPASDIFFTADFQNSSYAPQVPTGRLSVTTPEQVIQYLNKVKEYDALSPTAPWRKNILQLGGGKTTSEINLIASYLREYKKIAEGPLLGAKVTEKYRQNVSEVVETVNVADEVNNGVSLITFFGHSAAGATDLDIGLASVAVNGYKNKGKYPVMLMNGCNAGNAFVPGNVPNSTSFGEDWLATADKGAVAMIAHSDAGYLNFLNLYSSFFYSTAFQDEAFYGKPLGTIQQETVKRVLNATGSDIARAMVTEMVLQGDPALTLYSPAKPDYLFSGSAFTISTDDKSTVTAATEKFDLTVGVNNLGKAIPDSVYIKVKRTLANNTVLILDSIKVAPILKEGTITLPINNSGVASLGMNMFDIYLDSPNTIEEYNEDNNIGHFQHYFPASGLITLAPATYGIVNTPQVKLVAQATQLESNQQGYYFEIDTTTAFNSPARLTHLADKALLPMWELNLPAPEKTVDSLVYYWRVRFQNYEAGEDTVWATSSFRYIQNGSNGWSQSHYGQFAHTQTDKISQTGKQNIKWEFDPVLAEVGVKAVGGDERYKLNQYNLYYNSKPLIARECENPDVSALPRIYVALVNNIDLALVENFNPNVTCSTFPYVYEFGDISNSANQLKLENFLKSVPEGYYVIAGTVNKVPFSAFPASLKNEFKHIGSSLIDQLQTGYPFAIIGQKGAAPGTVKELSATVEPPAPAPTSQAISLQTVLKTKHMAGTLTSSPVGTALSWGALYHNVSRNGEGNDKYKLSVIGVEATGKEQVLVENVNTKTYDLTHIDAHTYPVLKLQAFVSDSTARTAPQLREWLVYYEAAPEGVIRPDLVQVNEDILTTQANQGKLTMPMAFQNVTNVPFPDSLAVDVTLTGDGIQATTSRIKIKPAGANETVNFSYSMPTLSMDGSYKLSMFVNPHVQPEQQYFNNFYEVPFKVKSKLHPIMDVAFDGVHILDGELVSPSPLISIVVKDENRQAYLQDPSTMSVIIIQPDGQQKEVSLANNPEEVRFYPADEKNDFRLEYKPLHLEDGKYSMEVQAKDIAGKAAGASPYRIGFEVVNEASVTNFYPYPNPFSSKTQFIFTLTGSTIPEHMKIQVMTVTGKVVKEIMKEEMGPLRIGNNKTEYAWDGTDMYGDKLANGVYLYRVVMSQVGEDMKHRYTAGDKAFKNGYGKLYILR